MNYPFTMLFHVELQHLELGFARSGGASRGFQPVFSNGKVDLKKGRGKATACGRDAAPGGSTFLPQCP